MSGDDSGRDAAALVARITSGDPAAEEELVARHSRGLRFLVRQFCRDPAAVDDLVQDVLRLTLEKARSGALEQPERLGAFLRGAARNLALAHGRRCARSTEELDERVDPGKSPLELLVAEEDRRRMRRLLAELRSPRDREVLLRYHLSEEPKEEICRALGLTSLQLNLVLFRARQRFRQLLERAGWPARPGSPSEETPQ